MAARVLTSCRRSSEGRLDKIVLMTFMRRGDDNEANCKFCFLSNCAQPKWFRLSQVLCVNKMIWFEAKSMRNEIWWWASRWHLRLNSLMSLAFIASLIWQSPRWSSEFVDFGSLRRHRTKTDDISEKFKENLWMNRWIILPALNSIRRVWIFLKY